MLYRPIYIYYNNTFIYYNKINNNNTCYFVIDNNYKYIYL